MLPHMPIVLGYIVLASMCHSLIKHLLEQNAIVCVNLVLPLKFIYPTTRTEYERMHVILMKTTLPLTGQLNISHYPEGGKRPNFH